MFLKLFPVWAPCAALTGFIFPTELSALKTYIVPLLTLVMLCMGLTLKPSDFVNVKKYKIAMLVGMLLQFSVMPVTALGLALLFNFDTELMIGMVLVGSVAGGTSSNVMTYLAGGNVALSISMTAISTLMSVVMTPLLLTVLVGTTVDVPTQAMLISLFKIILLPISVGVIINTFAHSMVIRIEKTLAPTAVITILIIIAIIVALNSERLSTIGGIVVLATLIHNTTGLLLGYLAANMLGFNHKIARTIAIEVGMQNSGLATALALKFFTPASALPGAIFSIWLNITGSIFASFCIRQDKQQAKVSTPPITKKQEEL